MNTVAIPTANPSEVVGIAHKLRESGPKNGPLEFGLPSAENILLTRIILSTHP